MDRADVVVIGAGAMGTAAARALAERGVDVVALERFRIGHASGSSHGPTRIFRLSYPHVDYTRLAKRALQGWANLEEASGERLLVRTGGLDVGPVARDCRAALDATGLASEWLSAAEAAQRFPAIDFGGLREILYQPDAGVCLAARTVEAQARVARRAGADLREDASVERLERTNSGGVRVWTAGGAIEARVAVVTAGSWAAPLLVDAGLPPLPLTAVLQHVSYFPGPGGTASPHLPTFIDWSGPDISWYALASAGEAPGVKVGQHVGGRPVDPAAGPFEVDPAMATVHSAYVRTRFPGLGPEPVLTETCLYTMTPDEDFILDRVGPVVIGSPCSGHGFKFAPLIGDVLADLALGSPPGPPGSRFALDRPALEKPSGFRISRP